MISLLFIYKSTALSNVVLLDLSSIETEDVLALLSILGALFYVIFRTGEVFNSLKNLHFRFGKVEKDVHILKKNVSNLNKHMNAVIERVNILWSNRNPLEQSKSPKQLSDIGKKILKESNIEAFIKQHFDEIVAKVKTSNPQNRYQAQEAIIEIIREFGDDDKYINYLEESAFESGTNVDSVLYVAALHFRDEITSQLNLKSREIDKHFTSA